MEEALVVNKGDDIMDLPPGFRFHPTDEEIITHYLMEKVMNISFSASAIGEADLNKCEPWDLPKKAKMGEKEWYFYFQRDRKYPTGMRTNRATKSGYWKATGKDKEIFKGKSRLVGMKKTLVFYRGRAPKGNKTNWVMHEYRLHGKFSYSNLPHKVAAKDEWVVCRIFHKNTGIIKSPINSGLLPRTNSFVDGLLVDCPPLPALLEPDLKYSHSAGRPGCSSFAEVEDDFTASSARSLPHGNHLSYFPRAFNIKNLDHLNQRKPDQYQNNSFLLSDKNFTYQMTSGKPIIPNSEIYAQIPIQDSLSPFQTSLYPGCRAKVSSMPATFVDSNHAISGKQASNNQTRGSESRCNVEKFSSNHSMVSLSQDTGLSTDMNIEISSEFSKRHEMETSINYENRKGPPLPVGPMADLACLWDTC